MKRAGGKDMDERKLTTTMFHEKPDAVMFMMKRLIKFHWTMLMIPLCKPQHHSLAEQILRRVAPNAERRGFMSDT
jgi:hypothetical protein